jgi:hypothetical protein
MGSLSTGSRNSRPSMVVSRLTGSNRPSMANPSRLTGRSRLSTVASNITPSRSLLPAACRPALCW